MYKDDLIRIVIKIYNNRKINGMSIIDILNYSNIARSTLYQWVYKYSHIQYDQFIDRTIKLRSYNKETAYKKKMNEQCIKNIIEYVSINPKINIKKIKKTILTKYKVSINKNYIYQIFKKNNITYKKAQKQKHPYNLDKFNNMKETLKQNISEINNDIISIDETGIVVKRKNDYAWSNSQKCIINEPNNYELRYSICMAINKNKIISYRLTKGGYNGRKFRNFLINHVIGKTNNKGILMDNASIHKTEKIKQELLTKNIKVIYNVPYHPEFNPIEYLFNTFRD